MWNWIGWIAAFIATIFAIRGNVHFDVNEWLKEKKKQNAIRLMMLCPHGRMTYENGKPVFRSTYISLPGATAWQCQQCGDVTHDYEVIKEISQYWASNPDKFIDNYKKSKKLAKKLGRI